MYKISIIVPVYNVEKYIIDCLTSISRQTYKGLIECIIVDDCGSDASIPLAETFIMEHSGSILFTILHHESNKGLSGARNTGLNAATGDYVFFLDSDDTITPNCISLLTEPLLCKDYDMIIGNISIVGKDNNFTKLKLATGEITTTKQIIRTKTSSQWYQMAWNKLYNVNFIRENGLLFKEGIIHEDELWSNEVASVANTMYVVNQKTYNYLIREASIMTSIKIKTKIDSILEIISSFSEFLREKDLYKSESHIELYYFMVDVFLAAIEREAEEYFPAFYLCVRAEMKKIKISIPMFDNIKTTIKRVHYLFSPKNGYRIYKILYK